MTKLGRGFVYMKRVFVRVFLKVFHQEEEALPCTIITLFKESCLHVHANLRSPNFDTQNSTQMFGIMWQACMFVLTKF